MKKISLLLLIILFVGIGVFFTVRIIRNNDEVKYREFDFSLEKKKKEFVENRYQNYRRIYDECNLSVINKIDFDLKIEEKYPVFSFTYEKKKLPENTEFALNFEEGDKVNLDNSSDSADIAVTEFFNNYSINDQDYIIFDYPDVILPSGIMGSYLKMPVYQKINDYFIYSFEVDLWKNSDQKYKLFFQPFTYEYPFYQVSEKQFDVEALSIEKIISKIENGFIKDNATYLNYDFFDGCEAGSDIEVNLTNAQIIYFLSNYLSPRIKLNFIDENNKELVVFADIIDENNYSNYSLFLNNEDVGLLDTLIISPRISEIISEDEGYTIKGKLPSNAYFNSSSEANDKWVKIDNTEIRLNFYESTDSFQGVNSSEVRITEEINKNLTYDNEGNFSTFLSYDTFWNVYDNLNGIWIERENNFSNTSVKFDLCISVPNEIFTDVGIDEKYLQNQYCSNQTETIYIPDRK